MVIDAATDQPDCHLKGKICHFSCEGCAEKEPPIHQCTPEFGGGPPKRLYHTAAGGRKLQSEYVRSYPVTQVCKHGYDATREKKQKNNVPAAAQQPAEKRPRRRLGGVVSPKQSEKQGPPTTQVRRRQQQQQKAAKVPRRRRPRNARLGCMEAAVATLTSFLGRAGRWKSQFMQTSRCRSMT